MKIGLNDVIFNYLDKWKVNTEKEKSLDLLKKLDESNLVLTGKPSTIAIAILYLSSTRSQIILIREFEKNFLITSTPMSVRKYIREIGDYFEIVRKRRR